MYGRALLILVVAGAVACGHQGPDATGLLTLEVDVPLPGGATRFDYQEIDPGKGQLVVAHMNDDAVLVIDLATGAVKQQLTGSSSSPARRRTS